MVMRNCGDDGVNFGLIRHFAAINWPHAIICARQVQMVKPAREPQWQGILQWQPRPIGNAPSDHIFALHERKLRLDDPRCHGRVVAAAMFGLHPHALCHMRIIHHAASKIIRCYIFCHIALSARDP